jgi:hypothetical protein
MKGTFAVALVIVASGIPSVATAKDASDYPLRVSIVETRWERNGVGGVIGSGHGNLAGSESVQGFDYTFSCDSPFNATQGTAFYPAKWKKPETRLEIFETRIGDTNKHDTCELKVTMMNVVYANDNGHLVTYTMEQWNKVIADRRMIAANTHPTDTDRTHYPLLVTILDAQWQASPLTGGAVGSGRGNIRNGTSTIAFDFSALCPGKLNASMQGQAPYTARWQQDGARLVILSHTIGEQQADRTCELKTDTHQTQVYLRNNTTGVVTAITQDEFRQRTARTANAAPAPQAIPASQAAPALSTPAAPAPTAPKVATPSKLTNSDVVTMATAGLSTDIIVAKMNSSTCDFDTSPDALRQLKGAHISDAIVLEMIKRSK